MKKLPFVLPVLLLSCASGTRGPASAEDFLWLEEVQGERALGFAKTENERTFDILKKDPGFAPLEKDIRAIHLAQDRLPAVRLLGGKLYNFWQDDKHVRGLWRRTTVKSYRSAKPVWDTVIDLDALAAREGENWVWKGVDCLGSAYERCLVTLSRGGKDASVKREFDLRRKVFVEDGFVVPEAKSIVSWMSRDELLVATDFGEGSLTESGYPRIVKRWKRGEPLAAAREVFRGETKDMSAGNFTSDRPESTDSFVVRTVSFYETEVFWIGEGGGLVRVPMPVSADFRAVFQGQLVYFLRQELVHEGRRFPAGSLVALPLASIGKGEAALAGLETVFAPSATRFLASVDATRSFLLLDVMDKVKGRVLRVSRAGWRAEELAVGGDGVAEVSSAEPESDAFLVVYTDFLTPTSYYLVEDKASLLKSSPARFDASGLAYEQREAVSKDGTKVPYFLVHKKGMKRDGKNPTLLYGYGGFEVPMTPRYSGTVGKAWLERGGVFAMANIRGGGEFGPAWHEAALKTNRQRAFDDFVAVAEDLVKRKVTSPRHLGIQGGSNGGLLVGTVFVQRPDLFNAALCEVPLLDMLRFHLLLAGASWVGEYGSPEIPEERAYLAGYSPFHNVRAGVKYPEVFFLTSTADDRVHPGHARKMVARMREQGHPLFYYENTEGGHGGSANLEQSILWSSLEFTYLWRKLK